MKALDNWQIKELVDGTVVIGSTNYAGFTRNSTYTLYRDKDILLEYSARRPEVYRRVCVQTRI